MQVRQKGQKAAWLPVTGILEMYGITIEFECTLNHRKKLMVKATTDLIETNNELLSKQTLKS